MEVTTASPALFNRRISLLLLALLAKMLLTTGCSPLAISEGQPVFKVNEDSQVTLDALTAQAMTAQDQTATYYPDADEMFDMESLTEIDVPSESTSVALVATETPSPSLDSMESATGVTLTPQDFAARQAALRAELKNRQEVKPSSEAELELIGAELIGAEWTEAEFTKAKSVETAAHEVESVETESTPPAVVTDPRPDGYPRLQSVEWNLNPLR